MKLSPPPEALEDSGVGTDLGEDNILWFVAAKNCSGAMSATALFETAERQAAQECFLAADSFFETAMGLASFTHFLLF